MTINLIFRIAAVGILVSVLGTVLKHSGRDEQAFFGEPCGSDTCFSVDSSVYRAVV